MKQNKNGLKHTTISWSKFQPAVRHIPCIGQRGAPCSAAKVLNNPPGAPSKTIVHQFRIHRFFARVATKQIEETRAKILHRQHSMRSESRKRLLDRENLRTNLRSLGDRFPNNHDYFRTQKPVDTKAREGDV